MSISLLMNLDLLQSLFYLAVGCATYAAFGDHSPGNILTGFGFYKPYCKFCTLLDFGLPRIHIMLTYHFLIWASSHAL